MSFTKLRSDRISFPQHYFKIQYVLQAYSNTWGPALNSLPVPVFFVYTKTEVVEEGVSLLTDAESARFSKVSGTPRKEDSSSVSSYSNLSHCNLSLALLGRCMILKGALFLSWCLQAVSTHPPRSWSSILCVFLWYCIEHEHDNSSFELFRGGLERWNCLLLGTGTLNVNQIPFRCTRSFQFWPNQSLWPCLTY